MQIVSVIIIIFNILYKTTQLSIVAGRKYNKQFVITVLYSNNMHNTLVMQLLSVALICTTMYAVITYK